MNIDTTPCEADLRNYRGKSPASLAAECLESLELTAVLDLTFFEGFPLTDKEKEKLEIYQRAKFENWANSWIAPKLRAIIAKQNKPKK